jgi:predicted esterase
MIKANHIRYVCPNAHVAPVSLNAGFRMPSWFDIKGLEPGCEEDTAGIKEAAELLQHLIAEEEKLGISRDRILVGGFSQGGAVALYSALAIAQSNLAGLIGLSTWLPLAKTFPACLKSNTEIPILQCHGEADPLVRIDIGKLTGDLLKKVCKNHDFKSYATMGHSSCEQEMQDVKKFIEARLPAV